MWMNEQLLAALQELRTTKSSLRSVAAAYGIPKITDSLITLTTIPFIGPYFIRDSFTLIMKPFLALFTQDHVLSLLRWQSAVAEDF